MLCIAFVADAYLVRLHSAHETPATMIARHDPFAFFFALGFWLVLFGGVTPQLAAIRDAWHARMLSPMQGMILAFLFTVTAVAVITKTLNALLLLALIEISIVIGVAIIRWVADDAP